MYQLLLLLTLGVVNGYRLRAGLHHSESVYHMIAQLPNGVDGLHVRFVDCTTSCDPTGDVLYETADASSDTAFDIERVQDNIYDIRYNVPVAYRRQHIIMVIRPTWCADTTCELHEEVRTECAVGQVWSEFACHDCEAGKYQHGSQCRDCSPGKTSGAADVSCHAVDSPSPVTHTHGVSIGMDWVVPVGTGVGGILLLVLLLVCCMCANKKSTGCEKKRDKKREVLYAPLMSDAVVLRPLKRESKRSKLEF